MSHKYRKSTPICSFPPLRYVGLFIATPLFLIGCALSREEQLARVAKDWSLSIRASQVIPVYPLTEDLEPGDVFLVQTPINEQVRVYEEKGFLPFDKHLLRVRPTGYPDFYKLSYGIAANDVPPHQWQFPPSTPLANEWDKAPHASFPTYSFSVQRGGGINLAVPVHGVPIGLNLIGSSSASGTISIASGRTYGIDTLSLLGQVLQWASQPPNQAFLSNFPPAPDPKTGMEQFFYLRVVNRIYLAGSVNISLSDDQTSGASLSGGVPKPVDLFATTKGDAGANYSQTLKTLNAAVADTLPGGTLKVAAASSGSISMVETFPRPLAIGFLAFELPILEHGKLGTLEWTHAKLSRIARIQSAGHTISAWLSSNTDRRTAVRQWLDIHNHASEGITNILFSLEFEDVRKQIIQNFHIQEE